MIRLSSVEALKAREKIKFDKDLAAACGLNAGYLSSVLSGRAAPSKGVTLSVIDNLCRVLKCQPGDILEYRPDS